jgi:four helix bundle protein
MGKILRFEEIEAWKKARVLTREIYQVTATGDFARDFGLRDQIRRASVSSMSNIAEGFERGGNREFIQFLSNAKGSTGEVRSQLYVALDVGFINQNKFGELYGHAEETSRLIAGFTRYLRQSNFRGEKFV